MRLQVLHETRYDYVPVVETAQHMCYLQPLVDARQQLLQHSLEITPTPTQRSSMTDVFGNGRQFFALQTPHSSLLLRASSLVDTVCEAMPPSSVAWEQVRDRFRYVAGAVFDTAGEYSFASPYVPRHADFAAYARPSFAPGVPLLQAAKDLMQRIHADFEYDSDSTHINTPAREALAQRKGVCQDFAHIMLACLRGLGLAGRYVSGYVLTHPPEGMERLVGSDASHAWVSVYLPDWPDGAQWLDLDPTNNRCGWGTPGADYVRLAVGRDYADVSPVRGVIHGGAHHNLHVAVTVTPMAADLFGAGAEMGREATTGQTQNQGQAQGQTWYQTQGTIE